jgi:hypothetical protein
VKTIPLAGYGYIDSEKYLGAFFTSGGRETILIISGRRAFLNPAALMNRLRRLS